MLNFNNPTLKTISIAHNPLDNNNVGPLFEMLESINRETGNTSDHFKEKADELDNFIEFLMVHFNFEGINGIDHNNFRGGIITLFEIRDAFQQIHKASLDIKQ